MIHIIKMLFTLAHNRIKDVDQYYPLDLETL